MINKEVIGYIFAFSLGAAAGAAVSWKLLKTKYEQIAQEEIDSVKKIFSERQSEVTEGDTENTDNKKLNVEELPVNSVEKFDIEQYKNNIKNFNYGEAEKVTKPYVIKPDEYDTLDGYDHDFLTYYSDGVLADDYDEPIEDVDAVVGIESLKHFGEYEEDILHVRNERDKIDYEITLDSRKFSDIIDHDPHPAEE